MGLLVVLFQSPSHIMHSLGLCLVETHVLPASTALGTATGSQQSMTSRLCALPMPRHAVRVFQSSLGRLS